jgi:hypothetical protein
VNVTLDYEASTSSIMEYLLTDHPYRWEITQLSNEQIERLRGMLHEAIEQRITPEDIYDAITRGFDQVLGVSVSSPPLANDFREEDANNERELMVALLREISPA